MSDEERRVSNFFRYQASFKMTGFLADAVMNQLCGNELIEQQPEWKELADKAHDALMGLYEKISEKHLSGD